MDRARVLAAMAGFVLPTACGGSGGLVSSGGPVTYDSAGITIVDHGALPDEEVRDLVSPEVVIGVTEGASESSSDGTIVVGDTGAPQLHRFHRDGSRSIVRWAGEAEEVTAAEVEAWKDRQRSASWTQHQLPRLERTWATQDIPDTKPFFGRVRTGSDGTTWLGPTEDLDASTTVAVFDPDGSHRGAVRFPGRFTVYDSGSGWVLGIMIDDNEVEFIHVYPL